MGTSLVLRYDDRPWELLKAEKEASGLKWELYILSKCVPAEKLAKAGINPDAHRRRASGKARA